MDSLLVVIFGFIAVMGALTTAFYREPYSKLISMSMMIGGIFPFIVDRGILDVAVATAVIAPISTIFILLICKKGEP